MKFTQFLEQTETIHVFCDMDGVLSDFPKQFKKYTGMTLPEATLSKGKNGVSETIRNFDEEYWVTMEWMHDGKILWEFLITTFPNLKILTSPSMDKHNKYMIESCRTGKIKWAKKHLNLNEDRVIVSGAKHKQIFPGVESKCILVDDTVRKIDKWKAAGGTGILHKSAKSSIEEFQKIIGGVS
jgi:hypothetical protein